MTKHVSAHVSTQVAALYMHLYVHPFTHSFILTCSFLRPTFPPKLALSWPYRWTWAHIRPTLGGKVGLKNAQVLMNIWMCRWRCRWKCWKLTCLRTCADLFVRLAHLHAHLFIRLARLHAHLFIPYFLHPYPFQEFSVYELSKLANVRVIMRAFQVLYVVFLLKCLILFDGWLTASVSGL